MDAWTQSAEEDREARVALDVLALDTNERLITGICCTLLP